MPRKRLLWQLYPSYLAIALVSLIAFGWLLFWFVKDFYQAEAESGLLARAQLITQMVQEPLTRGDHATLAALSDDLARRSEMRIIIVGPSGEAVADSDHGHSLTGSRANLPEVEEALLGKPSTSRRHSYAQGKDMLHAAVPLSENEKIVGALGVSIPATEFNRAVRQVRSRFLIGGACLLVLSGLIAVYAARKIGRPLEEIKRGAERFAGGDLSGRLMTGPHGEVGGLADALNRMAERLDDRIRTVLRQHNEREAVLSSMVEGVLAVDGEERIINLNQSAARLLGIDPEAAQGRKIEEVVRNTDLQKFVTRALESRQPIEGEIVMGEQAESLMQAHGTVLRDEGGRGAGAVIVINDITRLRRLENVRRDFVANVSHELKTPVTSIKGFVETLQDGALKNPEDAQRFLGIIARQTERLDAIIEDLLSLSRIEQEGERGEIALEEAALKPILQSAIDDCAVRVEAKQISVTLDCDEELACPVNAPLLEQAVVNLLDNAVKYSEPGKSIEISAARSGHEIKIQVKDEGCGIEPMHLTRVFERFYRVDKARSRALGGTGLGLAIVKHIVQAHHGSVGVQSQPGRGSTFTLRLPVGEPAAS